MHFAMAHEVGTIRQRSFNKMQKPKMKAEPNLVNNTKLLQKQAGNGPSRRHI